MNPVLNWIGLDVWDSIGLDCIDLFELERIQMKWLQLELNWCCIGIHWITLEMNWIEFYGHDLYWVVWVWMNLNLFELVCYDLKRTRLNWNEARWVELCLIVWIVLNWFGLNCIGIDMHGIELWLINLAWISLHCLELIWIDEKYIWLLLSLRWRIWTIGQVRHTLSTFY